MGELSSGSWRTVQAVSQIANSDGLLPTEDGLQQIEGLVVKVVAIG